MSFKQNDITDFLEYIIDHIKEDETLTLDDNQYQKEIYSPL